MIRRHLRSRSGMTTAEFAIAAAPLFAAVLGLVDLGRYGLTTSSLSTLASATSRALVIGCYSNAAIRSQSPATCGDPLSETEKRRIAPALFLDGTMPTVTVAPNGNMLVVRASQSFQPLMPFWGTRLSNPSQSVALPF
ncbi:pilus assembly protein [Belnapia sp. T6]|uniref:Pilus assembly protein n=1 Tax=Belnapia mucosa TaxID=2804532 RepID=A0ABS1V3P9_9PROT|nr:TadE/TadG family type IV pilus assembly protein [Belnapia mucosa]MBL6456316.1 pilus assembly protein [Belnapia mucosa]